MIDIAPMLTDIPAQLLAFLRRHSPRPAFAALRPLQPAPLKFLFATEFPLRVKFLALLLTALRTGGAVRACRLGKRGTACAQGNQPTCHHQL